MDLNGVPATGNKFLLHDVLRDQWHFQGFVVSDWESVRSLTTHGFSAGDADAAARAVNAGVDMEMTSTTFMDNLAGDLKQATVQQATVDQAVHDILLAKYRLGLFQHPYTDLAAAPLQLVTPEQRAASRQAATRVAVLLRNEGALLPLSANTKKIALIGPLADTKIDLEGSWSLASNPADSVSVLEGMRKRFPGANIQYTTGVEIERKQPSIFDGQFPSAKPRLQTDAQRTAEFQHALDLIKQADVAVLVLGELQNMSGERASRASLDLPGRPGGTPGSGDRDRQTHGARARQRPSARHHLGLQPTCPPFWTPGTAAQRPATPSQTFSQEQPFPAASFPSPGPAA